MQNGDVVIFNRQPSLHKMSMMGMFLFSFLRSCFLLVRRNFHFRRPLHFGNNFKQIVLLLVLLLKVIVYESSRTPLFVSISLWLLHTTLILMAMKWIFIFLNLLPQKLKLLKSWWSLDKLYLPSPIDPLWALFKTLFLVVAFSHAETLSLKKTLSWIFVCIYPILMANCRPQRSWNPNSCGLGNNSSVWSFPTLTSKPRLVLIILKKNLKYHLPVCLWTIDNFLLLCFSLSWSISSMILI